MRALFFSAGVVVLLASCATVDEYEYGYAKAYRTLPAGFEKVDVGGTPYWHHVGRFYRHDDQKGYLLVRPPRGAEQAAASGGAPPAPTGAPVATESARGFFTSGTLKKRGPARNVGRSALRRGRLIDE